MFTMRFQFKEREVKDINRVNEALSAMKLSGLGIGALEGFLAQTIHYPRETDRQPQTAYWYGFDLLELTCEDEEDEEKYCWQIETAAVPKGRFGSSGDFHDLWCRRHPDRTMRSLRMYSFDQADAFVILHHEKADAGSAPGAGRITGLLRRR